MQVKPEPEPTDDQLDRENLPALTSKCVKNAGLKILAAQAFTMLIPKQDDAHSHPYCLTHGAGPKKSVIIDSLTVKELMLHVKVSISNL